MLRRIRYLTLLGLAGVALWVVAPALSLDPYMPEAVDFEQPLASVERLGGATKSAGGGAGARHGDEGPVTHLSAAIVAPHRFDLVGLGGEMRPLELRARAAGEPWSAWVETANGDPLYTGGTDEVQVRTRGWRPEGTLHYVNVSGTATAAESLLSDAREAVNGGLISLAGLVDSEAVADVPKPQIVGRRE